MRKLVLATRNEHKVKELTELLHGISFDIKTLKDYPHIPHIEENGKTYKENAMHKAIMVANYTGELALADDTGLEVSVLSGRPGVHSKRFADSDDLRIHKLLQAMETTDPTNRKARFVCVIAIAEPHGQCWEVQATCDGLIAPGPVGTNGFGYDPIFYFPEIKKTFAQLNSHEKAQYGHRGKAMRNARVLLNKIKTATPAPIISKDTTPKISRFASIDIGTNCLRILIAEMDKNHGFKPIVRHSEIVRLGHGMADKKLTPGGMNRVFNQMDCYLEILKKNPVSDIFLGATSAVREAVNQGEFLQAFYDKFKLRIKVLTGEEEARLTFHGTTSDISAENILIMDVGGGSTELIQGKHKDIIKEKSLPIGAVRLTEKYIFHDPLKSTEVDAVVAHIQKELKALEFEGVDPTYNLIGTGGTLTTIAAMSQHMEKYDSTKIHGYEISLQDVELLSDELIQRPIEQRKELPGLHPDRADVILTGVLICRETMRHFQLKQLIVSERDLLDGLILSNINQPSSSES